MSRLQDALRSVGAVLKRDKKHLVYELPNGQNVTIAATPSDRRAEANAIRDVRHAAGVVPQPKTSTRHEKKRKPGRREPQWTVTLSPMAAALRDAGIVEEQLRTEIEQLRRDKAAISKVLDDTLDDLLQATSEFGALRSSRWVRLGARLGLV